MLSGALRFRRSRASCCALCVCILYLFSSFALSFALCLGFFFSAAAAAQLSTRTWSVPACCVFVRSHRMAWAFLCVFFVFIFASSMYHSRDPESNPMRFGYIDLWTIMVQRYMIINTEPARARAPTLISMHNSYADNFRPPNDNARPLFSFTFGEFLVRSCLCNEKKDRISQMSFICGQRNMPASVLSSENASLCSFFYLLTLNTYSLSWIFFFIHMQSLLSFAPHSLFLLLLLLFYLPNIFWMNKIFWMIFSWFSLTFFNN